MKTNSKTNRQKSKVQKTKATAQHPAVPPPNSGATSGSDLGLQTLVSSAPIRHSLRNTSGFWELVFDDQPAVLVQDQALFYVAWLLGHPSVPPIEARDLAGTVYDLYAPHSDFSQALPWVPDRQDESQVAKLLVLKQERLEAILDSPDELEPVQNEALRELVVVYQLQQTCAELIAESARNIADLLAHSLCQLHSRLASAVDGKGEPHPVLHPFARHLLLYLIIPSIRGSGPDRVPRFIYEPPSGVSWDTGEVK